MPPIIRRPLDLSALQVYQALDSLGFDTSNAQNLADELRQIDLGLPAEDEFAATIVWMGRCKFLQKLRQDQYPRQSLNDFRVPDFLAVFDHHGRERAFLIQVKSTRHRVLKWSPNYFARQQRYAALVGLPLLVAWQWRQLGVWTLFDSGHLANGLRLDFEDALAQTLMSGLAGEFWVKFQVGVGLHIVADVIAGPDGRPPVVRNDGLLDPGDYTLRTREAYFTDGQNHRFQRLDPPALWPLLITSPALGYDDRFEGLSVTMSFAIEDDDNPLHMAQRLLPLLLEYQYGRDIHWRSVLDRRVYPVEFQEIRDAVARGIQTGYVQYVFDIAPRDRPAFL